MALEYIKVNPNLRSMIVYPTGYKDNKLKEIKKIIKEYGYLYYEKEIMLSKKGINNLIKELYRREVDWWNVSKRMVSWRKSASLC